MYSERLCETYWTYKANGTEDPVDVKEANQVVDFFHWLGNSKYM